MTTSRVLGLAARIARVVALAVSLGWLAYTLVSWALVWDPADAGAYYDAAVRLLNSEQLYPPMDPDAHEVYRYAPWFAFAWIPLTALPREAATHLWSLAMVACSALAVVPLVRRRTWASITLASLLGQTLLETSIYGNVQPAVVALLVWTAYLRSFPAWVGVAASIKLAPIAFVLVWLGRREWKPALAATGVAALLIAPILVFDLSNYVTSPGTLASPLYALGTEIWLAGSAACTALVIILAMRHSPYAWVAAAVLMFLAPPRAVPSYLAFVLVAVELMKRDDAHNSPGPTQRATANSPASAEALSDESM